MNNLTDNIEYSLQQHYAAAQLLSNSSNNNHSDSNNSNSNNQQQQHVTNQQQQHQDPNAFNLNYSSFPLIRMAPPQLHQPTLAKELTVSSPSPQHQQPQQQQPQTIIPEQVQLNHTHNTSNSNIINNNSSHSNEGHASSISPTSTRNSNSSGRGTPIRVTRPPNAYLLFNKEMRKILKDQDPTMKVAEISKEVGSRWKDMPKEQKDQYVKQANKLKEEQRALHPSIMYIRRSRAELVKAGHFAKRSASTMLSSDQDQTSSSQVSSSPTVDLDSFISNNNTTEQQQVAAPTPPPSKKQKKTKREKRNSSIPKHPLSAYMWYLTEVRPETMQRFPGSNVGQISKLCADRWNTMSEEARLPWNSKAQLDKERYAREMQIYALQNDHHLGRGTRQKYRIPSSSSSPVTATATTTTHVVPHPQQQQLATDYHHHISHSNASAQQQQQQAVTAAAAAAALFYTTTNGNGADHDKLYHHHHLSTPTSPPTSILRNNHPNHNPMTLNPNALLQTSSGNNTTATIVTSSATDPY